MAQRTNQILFDLLRLRNEINRAKAELLLIRVTKRFAKFINKTRCDSYFDT